MEIVTQIQRRYTVTIPKALRKKLELKEGMELVWRLEGSRIVVYPKTFKTLHELFKGTLEYGEKQKREIEKELIKRTSEKRRT